MEINPNAAIMRQIIFIVQQLSQPRCIKRIETFQRNGIPIKVYGFDNGLYNQNLKQLPFKVHEIIKRDKNARRFQKLTFFHNTIRRIIKENASEDIFYFFGFEIASIAFLNHCKNYIYEEADVSAARIKNTMIRKPLLSLDQMIIRKSIFTVHTSEGFANYIFPKRKPKNIILMPNKLSAYFSPASRETTHPLDLDPQHIKFGFVGLIRYPDTIVRFAKIIGQHFPQHEFHFYGDAEKKEYIDNSLHNYDNVFFHGPFSNPSDLPSIYSSININIVCYDTQSGNVRIAEPNKLYESIFFKTPLVVSKQTFLSQKVERLGIGYSIDASSDDSIIQFIRNIKATELCAYKATMEQIKAETLIDTPDILINAINQLL